MGLGRWVQGIKGRLLFASLFPFLAFGIIFIFTYSGLDRLSTLLKSAHEDIIPSISALDDIRISQNRFGYRMWEGIVNPEDLKESIVEAKASLKKFNSEFEVYTKTSMMPEEQIIFDGSKADFKSFVDLANSILANVEKGTAEGLAQGRKDLDDKLHPVVSRLEEFNEKVTKLYAQRAAAEKIEFARAKSQIIQIMLMVTVGAGLFIFALLMLTAAKISNTVGEIAQKMTDSGHQVSSAVFQLSEAGNTLSQSSTETAASLEETVAALEELSAMVQMNSDNAKQAAALSISSRETAERGESEMKNLIQSMSEISQSSKKIEEIISVIDDIAFQTNLLALNAAVEAARAGEQGKGFAVVAEAVRALAQRSASSAKDISSLIKTSVDQVDHGRKIADSSGEVLGSIVGSIKKVSDLNNEIAAASGEQTTGIKQISKAMNQLDQSSQSNAASSEEIAATSGEINGLAQGSLNLTLRLNEAVLGRGEEPAKSSAGSEKGPIARAFTKKNAPGSAKTQTKTPTKTPAKTPTKTQAKVIPFTPKRKLNQAAAPGSSMIPFDEDESRTKLGSTDEF